MKKVLATLRALGILAVLLGILALVGWVAGVFPNGLEGSDPVASMTPEPAEGDETTADAGTQAAAAVVLDAGTAAAAATADPAAPPPREVPRYRTCEAPHPPTLVAAHLVGDPRPELLVGCADAFHVLGVSGANAGLLTVARVAMIAGAALPSGHRAVAGTPSAADVTGDSLPDLVVPFWSVDPAGATQGGSLHVLARLDNGAFDEAVQLAPIAAVDVVLEQLDGRAGLDIVALNRANALARRPSEAWVFRGGPAPTRATVLRSGIGGRGLAAADVDRDGHVDIAVVNADDPRLDIFFGDGTGAFPRSTTLTLEGGTELLRGDVNGDDAADLLAVAAGEVWLIAAGSAEALAPARVTTDALLSQVQLIDIDRDGRRDLVGISDGSLIWLRQGDDGAFVRQAALTAGELVPVAYAIANLDGNDTTDLAIVVRGAAEAAFELAVVSDIGGPPSTSGPRRELEDAPLSLRLTLQ